MAFRGGVFFCPLDSLDCSKHPPKIFQQPTGDESHREKNKIWANYPLYAGKTPSAPVVLEWVLGA